MRHAYLIIAHSNWKQLQLLLRLLDSDRNDIYIHIDKKAKDVPVNELKISTKKSSVEIFRTYEVYWGSYELVQSELLLFEQAHKLHYDYYHLLSGADLPIKPQKDILRFFEEHNGYEFIHYDTEPYVHFCRKNATRPSAGISCGSNEKAYRIPHKIRFAMGQHNR